MQRLRHAPRIARLVLVWLGLSLGVAIASPWVRPAGFAMVCSASGALQLAAFEDAPEAGATGTGALDCPLCLPLLAPPGVAPQRLAHRLPAPSLLPRSTSPCVPVQGAAPWPGCGPPDRV